MGLGVATASMPLKPTDLALDVIDGGQQGGIDDVNLAPDREHRVAQDRDCFIHTTTVGQMSAAACAPSSAIAGCSASDNCQVHGNSACC